MNAYLSFGGIELWHIAGWTMLHFLWLGTIVAAAALVGRLLLRRTAPNVRYAAALGCLLLLAALPIGVAAWLVARSERIAEVASPVAVDRIDSEASSAIIELSGREATLSTASLPEATPLPEPAPIAVGSAAATPLPAPRSPLPAAGTLAVSAIQTAVPYLPWLWLLGTPLTFALLAAGLVGTKRLRRASRPIDDGPITELLARLRASLRITRRVTIAVCDRIAAPVLVGIVRPAILVPPAALTGWTTDEIEMVVLHELAHVRRWDNLVNLVQRTIESLLFFHPAVWLVSTWVRREREACCDAVVVARTHRPHAYAELLVALAAQMPRSVLFHPAATSAMAASPLRTRIRRILDLEDDPMLISGKSLTLMLAVLLAAITLVAVSVTRATTSQEPAAQARASEPTAIQSSGSEEPTTEATESTELAKVDDDGTNSVESEKTDSRLVRATIIYPRFPIGELEGLQEFAQTFKDDSDVYAAMDRNGRLEVRGPPDLHVRVREILIDAHKESREEVRKAFEPLRSETYRVVSDGLREQLPDILERFQTDRPDGQGLEFKWNWTDDGSSVVIEAPPAAHEIFFKTFFEDWEVRVAQAQTQNNLKGLAIALLNYEHTYRALPPHAIYDANGKPLLSWRVLILPFLDPDHAELYKEFRLDEPWDSEHNRTLIARMPGVFNNPKLEDAEKTNYLAVVGEECVFDGSSQGLKLSRIFDGTSKTIALVEADADQAVEWTKPDDWHFDRAAPTSRLGGLWGDRWYAAWVDGSVQRVDNREPSDKVGIQFTRAGGETHSLKESEGRSNEAQSTGEAGFGEMGGFGGEVAMEGGFRYGPAEMGVAEPFDEPINANRSASPDEDQVVVTIPKDAEQRPTLEELVEAAVSVLQKGMIPDLIGRDDHHVVVAKRPPTEADWPAVLGDPPRKDRVIAEKAWQRLGLKLVPITNHEQSLRQTFVSKYGHGHLLPSGIRIIGGNVPEGLPLPSFLIMVGGSGVGNFDDLLVWLDSERRRGQMGETVRVYAVAEGNQYLFDAGPVAPAEPAKPAEPPADADPEVSALGKEELDVIREHVDIAEQQFKRLDGLYKTGSPGGTVDAREVAAYELALARAELALAEGKPEQALAKLEEARTHAEEALKAVTAQYEFGKVTYDRVLEAARNLSDIKRRIIRLQRREPEAPVESVQLPMGRPSGRAAADQPGRYPAYVPPQAVSPDKSALRYDGKTFDEWRTAWQTELSTVKRREAVKALAAFGRAGYGKEAAEAILDVAGQYDFLIIPSGSEGELKEAVFEALTPEYHRHTMAEHWVPDLAERLEKEPKKWQSLAFYLLDRLRTDDERIMETLRPLAETDPAEVRLAALGALVRASQARSGGPQIDDKTREILVARLQSDDPEVVQQTLRLLLYPTIRHSATPSQVAFQPELIPLLFHADEAVRRQARGVLAYIDKKDTPQVVQQLITVLQDESRAADHVHAVRALAAMNRRASEAIVELEKLLRRSDDEEVLYATLVALHLLGGERDARHPDALPAGLSDEEKSTLFEKLGQSYPDSRPIFENLGRERSRLFPPEQNRGGGGGVF